jgi:hypothetical protein
MSILVDYRCDQCLGRTEAWVPSPVPATWPCPACGAAAKRAWSPVGLLRGPAGLSSSTGPAGRAEAPPLAESRAAEPLCARNPDVPGLCHMSPSAGRAWLARARNDNRALDRELERQERAAAVRAPVLADAVAHDHGHGQGHDHGHGHGPADGG